MKEKLKNSYRRTINAIMQNKAYYIFGLLSVLLSAMFVCVMLNKTLPFAEGWYTYYAKCINGGLSPYVDFEYLYSPVYIYFTAVFTRLFGYDIMSIRALGIIFFSLIAIGLYMSVCLIVGKKRSWIALVASVAGVFYLQSEIVQVFYDYVRLMDACAAFSLYFLLKSVKLISEREKATKSLIPLGILLALFTNIKQNTGMIFSAFSIVLIIYVCIWAGSKAKEIIKNVLIILAPIAVISAAIYGALLINGSLSTYLSMTGLAAASAKGGMYAILFGWLSNNKAAFINAFPIAAAFLAIIIGLYFLRKYYFKKHTEGINGEKKELDHFLGIGFSVLFVIGIIALTLSRGFAQWLAPKHYFSPYAIFLTVFPIFVIFGVWGIVDMFRKKDTLKDNILLFSLSGAYFAIAFACANSGGIAEGQSSFGVAFIITALLLLLDFAYAKIARVAVVAVCLVFALQCAGKKMLTTYNWWGMDESDYWSNTEELDLELLDGIKVSPETKYVYEEICKQIKSNTDPDDPIFCFPQLPLFYNLCDRSDPGTFTKVQWFDVSTDKSVIADIEVLKKNPPKAILIYNTSDGAYNAHEGSFRGGNESGTRVMREFLYNFVSDNGYRLVERYNANSNYITLWVADDSGETPAVNFLRGDGSSENPYVISSPEQLRYFCDMIDAGRTFDHQYISLGADIDMAGAELSPIGNDEDNTHFAGHFDGCGYTIKNVVLKPTDDEDNTNDTEDSTEKDEEEEIIIPFFATSHGTAENIKFENCPFTQATPEKK